MAACMQRALLSFVLAYGVSAVSIVAPGTAFAGPVANKSYDIPSQDMAAALEAFGRQSGQDIMFDSAAVRGKRSHPLGGHHAPREALRIILGDSGLTARATGSEAFVIETQTIRATPREHRKPKAPARPSPLSEARDQAADQPASAAGDIVVTAQKRSERINSVPMSISAFSGQQLVNRGIDNVEDLRRIVPGFSATPTRFGTPVFTLRGIGFNESSLAASPAVSVYINETPLPFSAMARFASFDLDRVEVLKGPQGTLFGENSTGGAINYVAARPTRTFSAGVTGLYGRFDRVEVGGFASGPLGENAAMRIAVKKTGADGWQRSLTRDDSLGKVNQLVGRLTLDWSPVETVDFTLMANAWRDRSETRAPQFIGITQLNPKACLANPLRCVPAYLAASPRGDEGGARSADWDIGPDFGRHDYFYQVSGRFDWEAAPASTITSITSYEKYKQDFHTDNDGTRFQNTIVRNQGTAESLFQELRLKQAVGERFDFILGANYQRDKVVDQSNDTGIFDSTAKNAISAAIPILSFRSESTSQIQTLAAFGNAEFRVSDKLKAQAALRWTKVRTRNSACNGDSGDGTNARAFNTIIFGLTGRFGTIKPGECVTLTIVPTSAGRVVTPGLVRQTLTEDNLSWRVGLDYTPSPGMLIYANASQGYKSGSFPNLGATSPIQYRPAKQEKLIAYEVGAKASLLNRALQLNGALFYYDYYDKQVRGRLQDPLGIFGALEGLVNIPRSRLFGAELQATARPIDGLTATVGGTYLDSKVTSSFANFDPYGNAINFKGERYPYTPKWSLTGDVEYQWALDEGMKAFLGASANYQSKVTAAFRDPAIMGATLADPANSPGRTIPPNVFDIAGYALFDVRAGLIGASEKWRASAFIRNLFNKKYVINVAYSTDSTFQYAGLPRTYGITIGYQF